MRVCRPLRRVPAYRLGVQQIFHRSQLKTPVPLRRVTSSFVNLSTLVLQFGGQSNVGAEKVELMKNFLEEEMQRESRSGFFEDMLDPSIRLVTCLINLRLQGGESPSSVAGIREVRGTFLVFVLDALSAVCCCPGCCSWPPCLLCGPALPQYIYFYVFVR